MNIINIIVFAMLALSTVLTAEKTPGNKLKFVSTLNKVHAFLIQKNLLTRIVPSLLGISEYPSPLGWSKSSAKKHSHY